MDVGAPELLIILLVVLVLFGGAKLPQLAKSLGQAQTEFRKGRREGFGFGGDDTDEDRKPAAAPKAEADAEPEARADDAEPQPQPQPQADDTGDPPTGATS